jgi:GNAT superfamily N-acetyltransferase
VEIAEILALFDRQMRRDVADADGLFVSDGWSAVLWPPHDGDVAPLVARMREVPGYVEWKHYGHDRPVDLPERLLAAGLRPRDQESLLVAEAASIPATDLELEIAPQEYVELAATVFEHRFDLSERTVPVVCRADGLAVSGGRIDFYASDFAGLHGGVTLPAYRGRGFYTATVAKRAEIARERGYRFLFVDALPTSRPILERLGFTAISTTTPYVLPD